MKNLSYPLTKEIAARWFPQLPVKAGDNFPFLKLSPIRDFGKKKIKGFHLGFVIDEHVENSEGLFIHRSTPTTPCVRFTFETQQLDNVKTWKRGIEGLQIKLFANPIPNDHPFHAAIRDFASQIK